MKIKIAAMMLMTFVSFLSLTSYAADKSSLSCPKNQCSCIDHDGDQYCATVNQCCGIDGGLSCGGNPC